MEVRWFPKSVFSIITLVVILALVATPLQPGLYAQDNSQAACVDAERSAESNVNGGTWFAVGCLLGITGWIIALIVQPSVPASALVGKSPEYVAAYSDCYQRKAKSIQTSKALTGCLIGTGVFTALYVVLVAVAVSETDDF